MDKKIIRLFLGLGLILSIFGMASWLSQHKPYQHIRERDLDAGTLFYTESQEALEANFILQQRELKYFQDP